MLSFLLALLGGKTVFAMVTKTMKLHVLSHLVKAAIMFTHFDL
jgi:hypothetical protein